MKYLFNKENKVFWTILVVVFIIISLNFFQKEIKNAFYLISLPVQKPLWQKADSISSFFGAIGQSRQLKEESEKLKLEIQKLTGENSSLRELKKENEVLRQALDIGLEKEFQLSFVQIFSKDISQDFLLINKGSKEGIAEDMLVITQEKVLAGIVSEVYKDFSRVRLLSDKNSSFDAKISDSNIFGIVKGKGSLKMFLDFIPQDKEIKEGDLIITSELSGRYPKGLLIGFVEKVQKNDIKPFQQAEISPFFDITGENLFIVKKSND
ncbi:MAG TPA: rod shape-determining protein MreC [Candidatus Parcubacteria bacterium]|nr:rod shape-determining protein MreC [Candidatus Parcubacteria bacterium]|tara:strand:- start:561 stop:1358 length:798 start_codon:yes stop_codon:yes gene_type:complete